MRIEEVVGTRMREHREAKGVTQDQLGQELGHVLGRPWARQAVSAAEKGQRAFAAVELLAIADTLEIKCSDLLRPPPNVVEIHMPSGWFLSTQALETADEDREYPAAVHELVQMIMRDQFAAQDALVTATKNVSALRKHLSDEDDEPAEPKWEQVGGFSDEEPVVVDKKRTQRGVH